MDLLSYTPPTDLDLLDRAAPQPPDATCEECGEAFPWTWYPPAGHRHEGRLRARWVCAPVDPCQGCQEAHDVANEARRLSERQRASGVGEHHRWARWTDAVMPPKRLGTDQDAAAFAEHHATSDGPPRFYILHRNILAAKALSDWSPRSGHSIYLCGRAGSGKTLLASATATQLLTGGEVTRTPLDPKVLDAMASGGPEDLRTRMEAMGRDQVYRVEPVVATMMIDHASLYDRVKKAWSKDKDPLAEAADIPALILDDLGNLGTVDKQPHGFLEVAQRLIQSRYRDGLPMIITTNIPFNSRSVGGRTLHGVSDWFGERIASRLREMCGRHVYQLQSVSWRG